MPVYAMPQYGSPGLGALGARSMFETKDGKANWAGTAAAVFAPWSIYPDMKSAKNEPRIARDQANAETQRQELARQAEERKQARELELVQSANQRVSTSLSVLLNRTAAILSGAYPIAQGYQALGSQGLEALDLASQGLEEARSAFEGAQNRPDWSVEEARGKNEALRQTSDLINLTVRAANEASAIARGKPAGVSGLAGLGALGTSPLQEAFDKLFRKKKQAAREEKRDFKVDVASQQVMQAQAAVAQVKQSDTQFLLKVAGGAVVVGGILVALDRWFR